MLGDCSRRRRRERHEHILRVPHVFQLDPSVTSVISSYGEFVESSYDSFVVCIVRVGHFSSPKYSVPPYLLRLRDHQRRLRDHRPSPFAHLECPPPTRCGRASVLFVLPFSLILQVCYERTTLPPRGSRHPRLTLHSAQPSLARSEARHSV